MTARARLCAALLAASAVTVSGCACNSVGESTVHFECHWEVALTDLPGSTISVCLNNVCSTGAFDASTSASTNAALLDGELGYVEAGLASDTLNPSWGVVTIDTKGGRYRDGDVWEISITPPRAPDFFWSGSVAYVSHDQGCEDGTYQTLSMGISITP